MSNRRRFDFDGSDAAYITFLEERVLVLTKDVAALSTPTPTPTPTPGTREQSPAHSSEPPPRPSPFLQQSLINSSQVHGPPSPTALRFAQPTSTPYSHSHSHSHSHSTLHPHPHPQRVPRVEPDQRLSHHDPYQHRGGDDRVLSRRKDSSSSLEKPLKRQRVFVSYNTKKPKHWQQEMDVFLEDFRTASTIISTGEINSATSLFNLDEPPSMEPYSAFPRGSQMDFEGRFISYTTRLSRDGARKTRLSNFAKFIYDSWSHVQVQRCLTDVQGVNSRMREIHEEYGPSKSWDRTCERLRKAALWTNLLLRDLQGHCEPAQLFLLCTQNPARLVRFSEGTNSAMYFRKKLSKLRLDLAPGTAEDWTLSIPSFVQAFAYRKSSLIESSTGIAGQQLVTMMEGA